MNKKLLVLLLGTCIIIVGLLILEKVNNNSEKEDISVFNETIMNAAEEYIKANVDEYDNFKEVGDSITITVEELIEYNVLEKDIENPTKKDFSDIVIRLTIESESIINYEVLD